MIPNWDTVKSELRRKWWIVVIVALAGIWQGVLLVVPGLPNPFRF